MKKTKKYFSLDNTLPGELINKSQLTSGLKLLSEYLPNAGTFSLGFHINSGSRNEDNYPDGIAHFLEHYVFRRSKKYTNKEIAKRFEALGAVSNAFTTKEQTSFYVTALNSNFIKVFNLLAEVCLNPKFETQNIQKEKKIIISEIMSYEEDFEEMIYEIGSKLIYEDDELASPITGSIESVNEINKENLEKFHSEHYKASNIIISLAGSIPHSELLNLVEQIYVLNIKESKESKGKNSKAIIAKSSKLEIQKNSSQSHLLFMNCFFESKIRNRYVISLINTIFGDGLSSRLYLKLREKKALAYNVYSSLSNLNDISELSIYCSFDPSQKDEVRKTIFNELALVEKEGFSEKEIATAKELMKTYSVMEGESSLNKMNIIARQEMLYGVQESTLDSIKQIESITKKEIDSLLSFFKSENWTEILINP